MLSLTDLKPKGKTWKHNSNIAKKIDGRFGRKDIKDLSDLSYEEAVKFERIVTSSPTQTRQLHVMCVGAHMSKETVCFVDVDTTDITDILIKR